MPGRASRIGLLIAMLLLAPATTWAGSSQALLSIGAVVPARCAVRMPGALKASEVSAGLARETVTMRCTKGALPFGGASSAGAVGPRISRNLVLTGGSSATAPRPLAETAQSGTPATAPRLVVTVNF